MSDLPDCLAATCRSTTLGRIPPQTVPAVKGGAPQSPMNRQARIISISNLSEYAAVVATLQADPISRFRALIGGDALMTRMR
jgi:hypothetical protein